jgi:RNA polymerase sigma factor (sigma-70 family)
MVDMAMVPMSAGPQVPSSRPSLLPNGIVVPPQESDFAAVYNAHAATTRRYAKLILRDENLAADAAQEAFTSSWLLGDRYRPERGSYSAMLRTLVHHRAVDILRRRGPGPGTVTLEGSAAALLVDHNLGPESSAVASEQAARLWAAVMALTPRKRESVVLSYCHGYSNSRIAGLLGNPLGTVKGRIRAAKIDLVDLLAAEISIVD